VYVNEGPPLHYDMYEDETLFVINGTLQFYVNGKQFCAEADTTVYIPRNVSQSFRNINSQPVHVQILFAPSGRENYLEAISNINNNPPINITQANATAFQYGQVNINQTVQWNDQLCASTNITVTSTSTTNAVSNMSTTSTVSHMSTTSTVSSLSNASALFKLSSYLMFLILQSFCC
jgi:hypothetical protein